MLSTKHQRVGVFIDVQNMYYSARNLFDRKVNFGNVVKKLTGDRQLIRAVAYVVSTKTGENQPFFDALTNLGIETKEKELMEYLGGAKKADWDVGITVDAIKMSDNLDVVILISGDGDYIPLVKYLEHKGKIVEVASFRETTSTRLVEAVGKTHYINLSENKRAFLIPNRGGSRATRTASRTTTKTKSSSAPRKGASRPTPKEVKKDPVADKDLSPNERALNN